MYTYLTPSYSYHQKGGLTTHGRRKFNTYKGPKGGNGASWVGDPQVAVLDWDKGNLSKSDKVFISGYWRYDAEASGWRQIIDVYHPLKVQYLVLAKNYGG